MGKSRKNIVFHIGDRVRIIKPEIFIRCGYPKIKLDFPVTVTEKEKISNFLQSLGIKHDSLYYIPNSSLEKICDEISYLRLRQANFGGENREIHTTSDFNLLNQIGQVVGKRVVKTGVYSSAYIDYDGYSQSAFLENEKSHVILKLNVSDSYSTIQPYLEIEIEEKNVEKYKIN